MALVRKLGYSIWYTNAEALHQTTPGLHGVQARKRVVVAYKTAEYRQAAVHNVGRRDVVLEIGCHEGGSTCCAVL